jgi:hypothetical protein
MGADRNLRDRTGAIMRRTLGSITLVCCLFAATRFAPAQTRKPGLWILTSTTKWKQSPNPAGSPASGVHTTPFCVTQQYFDKYGAILPQIGGCRVNNIVKNGNGMTGSMECTGKMSGRLSLESSWTDDEHAAGKVHFFGSMQVGPSRVPVEWTSVTRSIYKGPDCGSVKPIPMPDE